MQDTPTTQCTCIGGNAEAHVSADITSSRFGTTCLASELTFTNDTGARVDGSGAIFSWLRAVSNSLLRLTPTTSLIAEYVR